jgi:GAF domain-containing protein
MIQDGESNSGVPGKAADPIAGKQDNPLPFDIRGTEQQLTELLTKWQRQARGLVAVNNIARIIVSSQGLAEILAAAVDEIQESLGVASAKVILLDPNSGQLVYYSLAGSEGTMSASQANEEAEDLAAQVIQSGHSIRIDEAPRTESRRSFSSPACATMCVPLLACERVVGAIQVTNKLQHRTAGKASPFDEQDQEVLEGVAAFVAMAVENARLQEATRAQAAAQVLQETVVTLAHYVNNPLQGMVGAAELLKERLERSHRLDGEAPTGENHTVGLLELIIDNAQEISAVLRLLQDVSLPQSTTYVGSQQMLDIEEELQARMEAMEP